MSQRGDADLRKPRAQSVLLPGTRLEQEAAEVELLQRFAADESQFLQKKRCVELLS
jgi:hypothetical protein